MKTLTLSGVSKSFGKEKVLKDINLEVKEGEILALVGQSGCGKTTILRTIAGLEVPDSGEVLLGKLDITNERVQNRKVGMVFQNLALFPHMTVRQNVLFGATFNQKSGLNKLLKLTGLTDLKGRYPHELSGGQQQRVALARTLASEPEVLLLDEPFSNLDELTREKVRTEILQLIKTVGITTILVTHHPIDAFMMTDKIAMMKEGEILQEGEPEEIYQHPSSDYTAAFLGATVFMPGKKNGDQVDTPFGTLDFRISQDTTIFMRPESIKLSNKEGQLTGEVKTKLFSGAHEILVIKNKADDYHILVETEHSHFNSGDQIYLTPDSEKIIELKSIL